MIIYWKKLPKNLHISRFFCNFADTRKKEVIRMGRFLFIKNSYRSLENCIIRQSPLDRVAR